MDDLAFLREHEADIKRLTSWRWAVDDSSGKVYYYDSRSKATSWSASKVHMSTQQLEIRVLARKLQGLLKE